MEVVSESEDGEDRCSGSCGNIEEVERSRSKMPSDELLCRLGELFKTFGDFTRVRIVSALMSGELCVCEIASVLDMNVSAVSHQLRVLRHAKLVRTRRDGKQIYYTVDDHHVGILFSAGMEHVREGR